MDTHGNINAAEGCDRCYNCGNKYWENDKCIDCGMLVEISKNRAFAAGARVMATEVLSWQLDNLGTHAGTVEVIPFPEAPVRQLRRSWATEEIPNDGRRVIFHGGLAYLVRDVQR